MEKNLVYVVTYYSVFQGENDGDEILIFKDKKDALEQYDKYVAYAMGLFEDEDEDTVKETSYDLDNSQGYCIYKKDYFASDRIEVQFKTIEVQ